jgi:hypothetical protein
VSVHCFLLFLCYKKVTQEIFSELDETKASRPEFHRSFQRTEEEIEWGHEGPDGMVMVCEINKVNDRPVGKPQEQGVMNIAVSFSLSKKPR